MKTGILKYDTEGKLVCNICQRSFHRLATHTRQAHQLSAFEYK